MISVYHIYILMNLSRYGDEGSPQACVVDNDTFDCTHTTSFKLQVIYLPINVDDLVSDSDSNLWNTNKRARSSCMVPK